MERRQIGTDRRNRGQLVFDIQTHNDQPNRKTDNTNALHKRMIGFIQNLPEKPSLNLPFALPSGTGKSFCTQGKY